MPNTPQTFKTDLREVTARNENARAIISGFSSALPTLAHFWQQIQTALDDTPLLVTELTLIRLDYANIVAAGRATLTAHHDGDDDPLSYLRDELHAQGWGRA